MTTSIIFTYLFRIGTKNYRSFIRNSKLMFITTKWIYYRITNTIQCSRKNRKVYDNRYDIIPCIKTNGAIVVPYYDNKDKKKEQLWFHKETPVVCGIFIIYVGMSVASVIAGFNFPRHRISMLMLVHQDI